MRGAHIKCSCCQYLIDPQVFSAGPSATCPACRRTITAFVFPALTKPQIAERPETLVAAEDASCFYHQQNRAAIVCDGCGRFLCRLCDIEVQGRHLCPACVQTGVKKRNVAPLDHNRIIYGQVAAALALLPLLIWPITCLTAPAAIFLAIRYWKHPGSAVGGSHVYHVCAIVIGAAEIAGWILFVSRAVMKL